MKKSLPHLLAAAALTAASANAATTWNGSAGTWLTGDSTIWDSAFTNGDSVTFGGTTGQTITVDGAGVSPTATTVSNTGTMVFSGGSISGTLTKSGAGSLTLNAANSFSSVAVNGGNLSLGNAGALGSGTVTMGTGVSTNTTTSAMIVTTALTGSQTIANNIVLANDTVASNRGLYMNGSVGTNVLTLGGAITGGSSFTTLYLNNSTSGATGPQYRLSNSANTFTASILINRGGLQIDSNEALGNLANTVTFDSNNGAALTFLNAMTYTHATTLSTDTNFDTGANAVTASGVIGGGKRLTKVGSGTLTLSNTNTYAGGTTISAGTLKLSNAGALGAGNVAIAATGTLDASGLAGSSTVSKAIALSGTGTTGLTVLNGAGNGTEFSGNITGTTATLFLNTAASGDSEGLVTLSGTNSFTATTGVQLNRGSLQVKSATGLGATTNSVRLDSNSSVNGNLRFDNAVTSIANSINIITGGNTIAGTASGVTISGVISGASWQKVVAGTTLRLSGVNTASGTTVAAGTLNITSTGSINVSAAGGVSVASGAILAVDGMLNVTAITASITNGGTLTFAASGSSIVIGSVFDGLSGNTYQLITGAGSITNGTAVGFDLTGSTVWSSATLDNAGLVTFTAVPEPSTYGLLGAGALAAVAFVRRRRKTA